MYNGNDLLSEQFSVLIEEWYIANKQYAGNSWFGATKEKIKSEICATLDTFEYDQEQRLILNGKKSTFMDRLKNCKDFWKKL